MAVLINKRNCKKGDTADMSMTPSLRRLRKEDANSKAGGTKSQDPDEE